MTWTGLDDKLGAKVMKSHSLEKDALRFGLRRSFAIAHSHYENIDLATMSQGFVLGYSEAELEEIEESVAPLAQNLSIKIEDEVIPPRG